jgi:hypothetical protein
MIYNDLRDMWICHTDRILSAVQMQGVVNYTLKARGKMASTMPVGDRKERVIRAIESLRKGRVEQAVVNDGRTETTLYSK